MSKKFFINDANILIDLIKLELIDSFFRLEAVKFATTDFVFQELYEEQKELLIPFIQSDQLKIIKSSSEEIFEISKITVTSRGLSVEDCSVYYYAFKLQAILLTGDGKLRKLCEDEGVEAHGIIYLFDIMLSNAIIDYHTGSLKLKSLLSFNSRLPKREIDKRIKEWSKK